MRKLKSPPAVLREYDGVIKEQLHTGVIEEVQEAAHVQSGNLHREVIREDNDITKLRVVYDARSKDPLYICFRAAFLGE